MSPLPFFFTSCLLSSPFHSCPLLFPLFSPPLTFSVLFYLRRDSRDSFLSTPVFSPVFITLTFLSDVLLCFTVSSPVLPSFLCSPAALLFSLLLCLCFLLLFLLQFPLMFPLRVNYVGYNQTESPFPFQARFKAYGQLPLSVLPGTHVHTPFIFLG